MKKLMSLLAILPVLLLSACDDPALAVNTSVYYGINAEYGNYYLNFTNGNEPPDGYSCQSSTIEFATLTEMQDAFLHYKLSASQMNIIKAAFPRDDQNRILICNMNHLYQPVLPSDLVQNGVTLSGECYSFSLQYRDVDPTSAQSLNYPHGSFHYMTKDAYRSDFERNYEGFFENKLIYASAPTQGPDRNSTVYDYTTSAGSLRQVRYTLTDNGKTIYIDETYRLDMTDENLPESDTVPHRIDLYGCDNGKYFSISLFGFTQRPSEEWLSSFGLTEFVGAQ